MPEQFFAPCPRGLESALAEELAALGAAAVAATEGGVAFAGDWDLCYRVNLWSRIASRVLWRVAAGGYCNEEDLYRLARSIEWPALFDVTQTFLVSTAAQKSPLKSLNYVTLKIKDALCDAFRATCGSRPDVDTRAPEVRVHVFLTADHAMLYLDTSGEALFKRGWRQSKGEAPLKENLAAGILHLAGWRPGTPLFDPMCGSGTFLMEAAMMSLHIAPGLARAFGFENLRNFDPKLWARLRHEAAARRAPPEPLPLFGSDASAKAVAAVEQNFRAAGLDDVVTLARRDVLDIAPPAGNGILVMNPPYGERIGEAEALAALYPKLGDVLKQRFAGWRAFILTGDLRLPKLIRLTPSRRTPLYNGPIECRLYEFRLVPGSNRPARR